MLITQQQIRRAVPEVSNKYLDAFVAYFNMYSEVYEVNTPLRISHALAQFLHESGNLRYLEENLNYSADGLLKTFPKYFNAESAKQYARQPQKIASRVYANRMGNGNEASGDGWRYRGRGVLQLTGKIQYQNYTNSDLCVGNAVNDPDMIASFPEALKSAFWFWEVHDLNRLADKDDCRAITRIINGGYNGISNRQFLLRRFQKEFGVRKI